MRTAIALLALFLVALWQTEGQWEPQRHLISSSAAASLISAQSNPSPSKATSPKSSPPPQPVQTPLAGSGPTTAPSSADKEDLTQLLRGFLAVVEEDIRELHTSIDQLKTSQEKIAEQLKATQEQLARLIAKDSEQLGEAKTRAPAPQSIVTSSTAKRVPKISQPQTTAPRPSTLRERPE